MTSEKNTTPKISVVLPVYNQRPWVVAMTEFAIKSLRLHAADPNFELIVVEAEHHTCDPAVGSKFSEGLLRVDKYLNFNPKIGGVKEVNAGIDNATGEFILVSGTDIIVPPRWDAELLRLFDDIEDCGSACLSAF